MHGSATLIQRGNHRGEGRRDIPQRQQRLQAVAVADDCSAATLAK